MENTSNNIQSDLDDMHRAHIIMNETLTSRMDKMDASDKELSSQLNELKNLIQGNIVKPSSIPGQTERDQAITAELLFKGQMDSMCRTHYPTIHAVEDKGKAPERVHSPLPTSPIYQPFTSSSRLDPIIPITIPLHAQS